MNTPPASPRPGSPNSNCSEERSRGTSSKTFGPCVSKLGKLDCYADALKESLEKLCKASDVFWSKCVKVVQAEDSNKNWSSAYNRISENRNANVSNTVTGGLKNKIIQKLKYKINKDDIKSFLEKIGFEFDEISNGFKIKPPTGLCDNKDVKIFIADVNEFLVKSRLSKGGKKTRRQRQRQRQTRRA